MRKFTLFIFCLFVLSCSNSNDELNCTDGYPKLFGSPVVLEDKIDFYHYDEGTLTFVKSMPINQGFTNRTITLVSQNRLSDTSHPVDLDYELKDKCINDFRNFERKQLNEDCSLITIDQLSVGVNGTTLTGVFDCNKTDSMVIAEAIDFYAANEVFDTVQIIRFQVELSLVN